VGKNAWRPSRERGGQSGQPQLGEQWFFPRALKIFKIEARPQFFFFVIKTLAMAVRSPARRAGQPARPKETSTGSIPENICMPCQLALRHEGTPLLADATSRPHPSSYPQLDDDGDSGIVIAIVTRKSPGLHPNDAPQRCCGAQRTAGGVAKGQVGEQRCRRC